MFGRRFFVLAIGYWLLAIGYWLLAKIEMLILIGQIQKLFLLSEEPLNAISDITSLYSRTKTNSLIPFPCVSCMKDLSINYSEAEVD